MPQYINIRILSRAILLAVLLFSQCKDMDDYYRVKPNTIITEDQFPNSIFYQIFIQSFYDSNNDGIGDINGLIKKIDYLEELGIEAVWLLPIHPAMSYHKYDITDYKGINQDYGNMDDFKILVNELHNRGIKVIIDLVVNHTGSDHPWFKEAIKNPSSKYRDYYIWSSDKDEISKENHHWHSEIDKGSDISSTEKYYGFFWHEMPDLNYDNKNVREEIKNIGKFWLEEIGIDGFRLDAVRFFYPVEEQDKNYKWWQEFRSEMESVNADFFCVGEIWGEDTIIAPFLEKGIHAGFNFDLSYSIMNAVKNGKPNNLVERLIKTYDLYSTYEPSYTDATFLTNHDQNRIMSELKGVKYKAKLAASILFTLPGSPFIYYGEELGMMGKKPDENIREPFLWSENSEGNCDWMNPRYNTIDSLSSLEDQRLDSNSIYSHYGNLIQLRKNSETLRLGNISPVSSTNDSFLIYSRSLNNEYLLVIHNLKNTSSELKFEEFEKGYQRLIFSSKGDIKKQGNNIIIPGGCSLIFSSINK